jgi:hypothetical protein
MYGTDTRNKKTVTNTVFKYKLLEYKAVDAINQIAKDDIASHLNPPTPAEDLKQGDIMVKIITKKIRIDVKNNGWISLNSIKQFAGDFYMMHYDGEFLMVNKHDILEHLMTIKNEFNQNIFNVKTDKYGNLLPESYDTFKSLKSIKWTINDKMAIGLMPLSKTPGIKLNKFFMGVPIEKFINDTTKHVKKYLLNKI